MKDHTLILVFIKNLAIVSGAFLCGSYFTSIFHQPTSMVGGLWAVISAIIVIETSHTETYKSAKHRLKGTFIGAIISGIYLYFFPFTIIGFLITIAIGVLICYLFQIPQAVKLTGITISVIMIVSSIENDLHPFVNAGLRFAESAIGTGIAVLVALLVYSVITFISGNKSR